MPMPGCVFFFVICAEVTFEIIKEEEKMFFSWFFLVVHWFSLAFLVFLGFSWYYLVYLVSLGFPCFFVVFLGFY